MMKYIIITNNPLVKEKYVDKEVEFYDKKYQEILQIVKNKMGISNCSNLCCKPKNKKETSEIFNIYEQDTNRQSQIPLKENQKDSIQDAFYVQRQ